MVVTCSAAVNIINCDMYMSEELGIYSQRLTYMLILSQRHLTAEPSRRDDSLVLPSMTTTVAGDEGLEIEKWYPHCLRIVLVQNLSYSTK